VYGEGDRLVSVGDGVELEFVPLSDTQFVMLSDVSTLDEKSVEFQCQPNGSVVLLLFGALLAIKN
jgi:hypothetical protein